MSVHVVSWVLRHSEARLGQRLVLLVLADHAQSDGSAAWPSVETIAAEARLSERQVQYALRGLQDAGVIALSGRSKNGTNVYQVVMSDEGADIAPVQSDAQGVQSIAPEPSLEPSLRTTTSVVVRRVSENGAQAIVSDVVDVFAAQDVPVPKRHVGMLARQTKELLESGFDERLLVLAAVTAERRGEPQNMHFIASDMAMARAGQRMTRREYEKALEDEMEVGAWKTATRSR